MRSEGEVSEPNINISIELMIFYIYYNKRRFELIIFRLKCYENHVTIEGSTDLPITRQRLQYPFLSRNYRHFT